MDIARRVAPVGGAQRFLVHLSDRRHGKRVQDHDLLGRVHRALDLLHDEANTGIPSSNVGRANLVLAQALGASGGQDEAKPASRSAYANLLTTLGSEHPDTQLSRELADARLPSH